MGKATKNIDTKIIGYLSALNVNEKKAVLSVVETFAKEAKTGSDFWAELNNEQKEAVERAIKEADEGKIKSHMQIMKSLRK